MEDYITAVIIGCCLGFGLYIVEAVAIISWFGLQLEHNHYAVQFWFWAQITIISFSYYKLTKGY